ncbi:MAG: hypothetical protein JXJ04_17585, partial [Spirochaetales bacterium]|nr:hypothetical protein [Spirochaetales bacterium]
ISANEGENGCITPEGMSVVAYGESLVYTITPDANFHIQDVFVDGVSVGAVEEYEFVQVTGNHTIDAEFAIDTFIITTQVVGNGSITPGGMSIVAYGRSLVYMIAPDEHHHIQDVVIDGISIGPVTEYEFTQVTANHTIHAEFAIDTFLISTNEGENGSITPAGDSVVEYGGSLVYAIAPDEHFHIQDVVIDGISIGPVTEYEFTQVTGNHTIHAEFAINTYTITSTTEGHGTITPSGTIIVNSGSNVKYIIVPSSGYKILDVLVDGISVGPVKSYVFSNITASHTIHAVFP